MRRVAFASLLGIMLPVCAAGQPLQHAQSKLVRAGWGFSCGQSKGQFDPAQKNTDISVAACDGVGPLTLGMDRLAAEKILGQPTSAKSFGSSTFYIYSLQVDEAAHMVTSAVVGYDSWGRVGSIQLIGLPWSGAWTFADIKLGDTGKSVIARLGEPHGISPSPNAGALVWDYLPWTFSFEVKGTIVSSIRVSE